jgi:hypothetical protein
LGTYMLTCILTTLPFFSFSFYFIIFTFTYICIHCLCYFPPTLSPNPQAPASRQNLFCPLFSDFA